MINSSFWTDRRVLVTGHTGFKGSWLTLFLQHLGSRVSGFSLPPDKSQSLFNSLFFGPSSSLNHSPFTHLTGDIRDLDALDSCIQRVQPEIVVHLAAQSLVLPGYLDPLTTWDINVQGVLKLLECLKRLDHFCAVVIVTTDKVYSNLEWSYGYRENDCLGGRDPYSASKAAAEIAVSSWRSSFCGCQSFQTQNLAIATARAGNVIGGGDWSVNRIIPDAIRSLIASEPIVLRNPYATRPWQHVLEPLVGYLTLAEKLFNSQSFDSVYTDAFNFGPSLESNRSVEQLIESLLELWPGSWSHSSSTLAPHEAQLLNLQSDKSFHYLNWSSKWNFSITLKRTAEWYKSVHLGQSPISACLADIYFYLDF